MRRSSQVPGPLAAMVLLATLLLTLFLSGCGAPALPETDPDMTGASIVSVSGQGEDRVLLLEVDIDGAKQAGIQNAGAGYTTASVRVNEKTTILRIVDGERERASIADVLDTRYLNVWFTGPIAESYPVQTAAGTILILQ